MRNVLCLGFGVILLLTPVDLALSWEASGELIFPREHWHNDGSCIVERPNGDMLVC